MSSKTSKFLSWVLVVFHFAVTVGALAPCKVRLRQDERYHIWDRTVAKLLGL